jgi:hypothetical protein
LQVTNATSKEVLASVQVSLKYDLDKGTLIKKEWQNRREWDAWPGFLGVTDIHGQAVVDIRWTVLDWSLGSKPPSWRDWVIGQPYLVTVRKDQDCEEFGLVMRPGESARGQAFTVHVLEIRQPSYVKTPGV